MTDNIFIPTQIPWETLKGKDLEECLYWLINSMGGKDLEWRLGGKGGGACDQGRDLEAYFYIPSPDAEISKQKWWIEAKGRSSTVEASAVKESVINAQGKLDLDILVIATNSTFSNPTRDWVKEWQTKNPRPKVRLWDRNNLENLFSQNPQAVYRLFSDALTPQGRLEVVRSRFWNYSSYSDSPTLEYLWEHHNSLKWNPESLIAVLFSEIANGNIVNRPWKILINKNEEISILEYGLVNLLYFCMRAENIGVNNKPYIKGIAFLLLLTLEKYSHEKILKSILNIWDSILGIKLPEEARNIFVLTIIKQLTSELRDVCSSDCMRISSELVELTEKECKNYWHRITISKTNIISKKEEEGGYLIFECFKKPCKIGFKVNQKNCCPLLKIYNDENYDNLEKVLKVLKFIVNQRLLLNKNKS